MCVFYCCCFFFFFLQTPGDGSCQYHAILDQMQCDQQIDPIHLRATVIYSILERSNFFLRTCGNNVRSVGFVFSFLFLINKNIQLFVVFFLQLSAIYNNEINLPEFSGPQKLTLYKYISYIAKQASASHEKQNNNNNNNKTNKWVICRIPGVILSRSLCWACCGTSGSQSSPLSKIVVLTTSSQCTSCGIAILPLSRRPTLSCFTTMSITTARQVRNTHTV